MTVKTPFGERRVFSYRHRQPENKKTKTSMKSYRISPANSFIAIVVLFSLVTQDFANAFVGNFPWLHSSVPILSLKAAPDGDGEDQSHEDALQNDADFYRDLRRAKMQMLGRSIPPEQARESAAQAEDDFLRAMRETKDEFQKAKDELGSDGAVDLFLDRIREEDERDDEEDQED